MMLQIVLLFVTHFLEYFCTDFALKFLELGSIVNLVTMIEIIRPHRHLFRIRIINETKGSLFCITEGWEDNQKLRAKITTPVRHLVIQHVFLKTTTSILLNIICHFTQTF